MDSEALEVEENVLKSNDVITRLHVGDTLTNRLDNTSSFVSQDDGESSLRVLAGQSIGILAVSISKSSP